MIDEDAAAAEVAAENLGSDGLVAATLRQTVRKILGMPLGVSRVATPAEGTQRAFLGR